MKPRNFPARKEIRRINIGRDKNLPFTNDELERIETARKIRTKKYRGK